MKERGKKMKVFLIPAFLCVFLFSFVTSDVSVADKLTVSDFYYATNGPLWLNKNNWLRGDPCTSKWFGITCDVRNVKITQMTFYDNKISVTLPNTFTTLSDLQNTAIVYVGLS